MGAQWWCRIRAVLGAVVLYVEQCAPSSSDHTRQINSNAGSKALFGPTADRSSSLFVVSKVQRGHADETVLVSTVWSHKKIVQIEALPRPVAIVVLDASKAADFRDAHQAISTASEAGRIALPPSPGANLVIFFMFRRRSMHALSYRSRLTKEVRLQYGGDPTAPYVGVPGQKSFLFIKLHAAGLPSCLQVILHRAFAYTGLSRTTATPSDSLGP
ncbi:hypothetical protein M406DRAFT_329926 [Cryphonectria parasitica EP155]|uniref:Uncharacterized protein n=1 Tax=Cryphonectria parasitica (strain ATCC 38755 / EP155) TaxID=660469 RepID=A0A9P5CPE9_CRYP1|nr:uncharacterized protein M406DRAFT_329926 [Cryphonectria parasitica EP155]KAF3766083.1 hypothetical protein M406DRAFT_329926 [Cryphonectria parasitica EP155]